MTLLRAEGITAVVTIDGDERTILDGIDLEIASGEIVDIVGPSGSGKSTLLTALAWINPLASGTLLLDGVPATASSPQHWRSQVTLLPQEPALIAPTVHEALLLPWELGVHADRSMPDESRIRKLLDEAGLADVAFDREVDRLSVGQQSRIAFIRTVLTRPRVLLLDEADAALDPVSAAAISGMTARFIALVEGSAVVRVRHRESDGLATRRLRLESGRLVEEAIA